MRPEEKLQLLFSNCNLHINQSYPFFSILAMVSPLKHKFRMQITKILILATCYMLHATCCYSQPEDYIRVAIIKEADSLSLKIQGSYQIKDAVKQKVLSGGRNLKTTVTTSRLGILIGGDNFSTNRLLISTGKKSIVVINERKFRGDVQFIKNENRRLLVTNLIDLEEYTKGILYHEASHYWPMEALKVQAIASRTYAIYEMKMNKDKDYDVTSDIYSQVYGGRTSERYRTNKAVEDTRGLVLTYKDKPFPTYYHATCAGHTEDASLLWNIDIAPLKGVVCGFCPDSPHFYWHNVLSLKGIEAKLAKTKFKIKGIKDIEPLSKDRSGRIRNLKLISKEKSLVISAKDFRNIIGPNVIKSTNFKLDIVNDDAVFEGLGWGHGVGLCQWGAYFMAKEGRRFNEILKFYYPQAEVK